MRTPFSINDASAYPAPDAVYNWRIYALAMSAAMGSAMFGYDSAFIGGSLSLPSFQTEFGFVGKSANALAGLEANVVSFFQAGGFFGAILSYPFQETLGRRITLLICGALFNLGAILEMVAASNASIGLVYAGRVVGGLSVGASSLIIPQYISECSPPAIRGRLVGIFDITLQFGQVIGFWINYGVNQNISSTSNSQWLVPFGFQLVLGTLLVICMFFQPESPRFLLKANREEQAVKNLTRIRQLPADDPYLRWEVDTIKEQLQREYDVGAHSSFWKKLKETFGSSSSRYRVFLGMALMMLQNFAGINALNYYSPTIFTSIGFTGTSVGLLATGIFGLVKSFATLIFMTFFIDRLGRRNSLMFGSAGAMVTMFYLAGYTKISGSFEATAKKDAGAYIAIVMIYLFAVSTAASWNAIPWLFCAEIFPTGIRSVCLVFTVCTQWVGQFIIVYSTPYMINNITYGTFLIFGVSLVVAIIVIFFLMPETKGLSLEEMDILFGLEGPTRTKRKRAEALIEETRLAEVLFPEGEKEGLAGRTENIEVVV